MASVIEAMPTKENYWPNIEKELTGGEPREYKKGAVLEISASPTTIFRKVLSGAVLVQDGRDCGRTFVWGPDHYFGEESIAEKAPVLGRISEALVPTTTLEWSGAEIWSKCLLHWELGAAVINMLQGQLRIANERALEHRMHRGRGDRLKNGQLRKYAISHLKLGWSPEQIAATAKDAVGISISHEAIYQFVYARVSKASNLIYAHQEDLRPYLSRRRRQRMRKGLRKPYRIDKGPLPSIDSRPQEIDERISVGHWEDDSIVCSPTIPVRLRTTNERKSGIVFIDKAHDRTMAEANRITLKRLGALPKKLRKTLTRDRGAENLGYETLQKELHITIYFAHAYSSWERGSNENTNGLIRRFFPKKTDFRTVSDEEIRMVERLLNSRPRKRLGWKTPYQVFYELTGVALES